MTAKRILIVDDEPDIVRTTGLALESEGYGIITAGTGKDALDTIRDEEIDLIILDIMLPDVNGDVLARILKSDEKHKRIPIIVISALSQRSDEESINKTGVDFYLKKPFELGQLSGKIKELLEAARLVKVQNP